MSDTNPDEGVAPTPAFPDPTEADAPDAGVADPGPDTEVGDTPDEAEAPAPTPEPEPEPEPTPDEANE